MDKRVQNKWLSLWKSQWEPSRQCLEKVAPKNSLCDQGDLCKKSPWDQPILGAAEFSSWEQSKSAAISHGVYGWMAQKKQLLKKNCAKVCISGVGRFLTWNAISLYIYIYIMTFFKQKWWKYLWTHLKSVVVPLCFHLSTVERWCKNIVCQWAIGAAQE